MNGIPGYLPTVTITRIEKREFYDCRFCHHELRDLAWLIPLGVVSQTIEAVGQVTITFPRPPSVRSGTLDARFVSVGDVPIVEITGLHHGHVYDEKI